MFLCRMELSQELEGSVMQVAQMLLSLLTIPANARSVEVSGNSSRLPVIAAL